MTFVEQTMQTQKLKTCLNTDQTHLQMFYLQAFTEKLKLSTYTETIQPKST